MRGKPDQTPMLIQVAGDSSSTETEGPLTPDSSLMDSQDDHAHLPEAAAKRQSEPRTSQSAKTTPLGYVPQPEERGRGRRETLTVDTKSARSASIEGAPSSGYERARSPYSFRPSRDTKSKDNCTSGELPLPRCRRVQNPAGQDVQSQHPHLPNRLGVVGSSSSAKGGDQRPVRPSLDRRASAMPQLGGPASASAARSRYVENSSDESDRDYAGIRSRSGKLTSDVMPTTATSYFDARHQSARQLGSDGHYSPPRTPLSPEHTRGSFLNRDALLNGPGLQQLSTLLEGHQSNQHRASPRPSPQVSPKVSPAPSPHPSPPRTPPERHHHRSHTVESLKKDSPGSLALSPLSSPPSSPHSTAQTFSARPMDQDAPPRPSPSYVNRTHLWDSAVLQMPDAVQTPKTNVPYPSGVPSHHRKSPPTDYNGSQYQPSRRASYAQSTAQGAPTLQPVHSLHRQRSAELRGQLPPLSTKTSAFPHNTDAPMTSNPKCRPESYTPVSSAATLGASLLEPGSSSARSRSTAPGSPSHHRHRSRSRAGSDTRFHQRSRSSAPVRLVPASDQAQPVMLPQCPRPEPVSGFDDWYTLDRHPSMAICPDCRHNIFGSGYERAFQRRTEAKQSHKVRCSLNDPWIRLACLLTFSRQRKDTRLLGHLAEVYNDEPPCPENRPSDDRVWYHLRDSDTSKDFEDFQVCSHCVCSLETIYPVLGDMFHRSRDLKKEPRVCSLRSDVHRLGKYLNLLVAMADEAKKTEKDPITSDFIWEVKWMTVISPCKGDKVHYGEDWHSHPDLPELTICQECYYKTVRPVLKSNRSSSRLASKITPEAKEIVGGASCKLYSPRMKQIFEIACRDKDFEYLQKAVLKRNNLHQDLLEAETVHHKHPADARAKEDFVWLQGKWRKLERRHE